MKKTERLLTLLLAFIMLLGVCPLKIMACGAQAFGAWAKNAVYSIAGVEDSPAWDGTTASGFARGNGTGRSPYIIESGEQLAYFGKQVNEGKSYDGNYFKLARNIVLNDTTAWESWGTTTEGTEEAPDEVIAPSNVWVPIDTKNSPFLGISDGNGCAVKGVYIKSTLDWKGLFVNVTYGSISNVGVIDSVIIGNKHVGGIVLLLRHQFLSCLHRRHCGVSGCKKHKGLL